MTGMADIRSGDALEQLRLMATASVRCCVTSPPYFGLRDYGMPGQLGLEASPAEYVERMVEVFREVRRVLTEDGTLWLNLGDSYVSAPQGPDMASCGLEGTRQNMSQSRKVASFRRDRAVVGNTRHRKAPAGLKVKDMLGVPWMVAFALRDDGWYLRSEIIWHKTNCMPESVTDRPTKSHEQIFLLTRSARYYYDAEALLETASPNTHARLAQNVEAQRGSTRANGGSRPTRPMKAVGGGPKSAVPGSGVKANTSFHEGVAGHVIERNARTVWSIPAQPYRGAHFATFPEELARRCIVAGSAPGDTVLDPFGGSGTVGQVATGNGRNAILIELNPAYVELAHARIGPLLCGSGQPSVGVSPAHQGRHLKND